MKLSDIKLKKYHLDYYKLSDSEVHDHDIGNEYAWCSAEHFQKYLDNSPGSVEVSVYDFPLTLRDITQVYSASDFDVNEDTFNEMTQDWKEQVDDLIDYYDLQLERDYNGYRKIKFEKLKDFKTFLNNYTYHLDTDGMADDGSKGDLVTFDSLKDKIDVQLRYGAVYTDDGFDGEDYFSQISQFIEYNCEHAYNKFNFNENKINIENALKALNSEED